MSRPTFTAGLRDTHLSRHASDRVRERSIPRSVVDALLDFGEQVRAGSGAETCFFSKRSWRRFAAYFGREALTPDLGLRSMVTQRCSPVVRTG